MKMLSVVVALLGVAVAASAGGHERAVVDSFSSPGDWPKGTVWVDDGGDGFLYHVDDQLSTAYSITVEGAWAELFDIGVLFGEDDVLMAAGLCVVPEEPFSHLFITDTQGHQTQSMYDMVYQVTTNGALIDTFGVEWFCDNVTGICYDGSDFWLCSAWGDVFRCNDAFDPLESFALADCSPQGIDYDSATGLFYLVNNQLNRIEVRDSDMNLVDAFPAPGLEPFGISIGRVVGESRTLWMTDWATDLIYQITDEYYTPVEPASWGALKTRFR
jgi:hypothetical protein